MLEENLRIRDEVEVKGIWFIFHKFIGSGRKQQFLPVCDPTCNRKAMLVFGDPPPVPGHVEGRVPAHDI